MKRAQPQSGLPILLRAFLTVIGLSLSVSLAAEAQRMDLAVTYTAQRSLNANSGQNFWMQGGSVEFGRDIWRGWGVAAVVTGTHTSSIAASGVPLSLVTETFGPRYHWSGPHKLSLYGQGLVGGASGFQSLFPGSTGTRSSARSLATQLGGGVDYQVTSRISVRVIDASWLRTQLPNGYNNVQNSLLLSGGATIRF